MTKEQKLQKAAEAIAHWQSVIDEETAKNDGHPLSKMLMAEAERELEYWSDVEESLNA
jgi:hypothetical protein